MAFVDQRFGRLDLLVNNAGIAPRQRLDILEATAESFDELIESGSGKGRSSAETIGRMMRKWAK